MPVNESVEILKVQMNTPADLHRRECAAPNQFPDTPDSTTQVDRGLFDCVEPLRDHRHDRYPGLFLRVIGHSNLDRRRQKSGGSLRHPPGPPDNGAGERADGSLRRTLPVGLSPVSLCRFDNSIHPQHSGGGKRDPDCCRTPRQDCHYHRIS